MIEESLKVLGQALNSANKAGVFNLQDSAIVAQALQNVIQFVNSNPLKENQTDVESETPKSKK
jgi:hypothetical protein